MFCVFQIYYAKPKSDINKGFIGSISRQSDSAIRKILLFGGNKLDFETNKILLMSTIEFISLTERFSCPLFGVNLNDSIV